jgi:hypothetical protein
MSTSTGFSKPTLLKSTGCVFSLCLLCSHATPQPAAAQVGAEETTQPVQITRSGVRYTTGMTQTSGWERPLVQRNSNLRHWNWSPMVSYNQSIRATNGPALAVAPHMIPLTPHYLKPIHIPLPLSAVRIADLNHQAGLAVSSRDESVSASLRQDPRANRDVCGHLVSPAILRYGPDSGTTIAAGSLTSESVRGVLRSR